VLEWPEGLGLSTQFFGLIFFMVFNLSKRNTLRYLALAAITGVAFAHYLWIVPKGLSASGLINYDRTSLVFVQSFLGFILLTHLFTGSDSRLKPEASAFLLAFSTLGTFLLLSNNLIIQITTLPIFFLMSVASPKVTRKGQSFQSLQTLLNWALLLLIILTLAASFIYLSSGSFQLQKFKVSDESAYFVGWTLIAAVLLSLIFLFPLGLLVEDHFQSEDWSISSNFRIGANLVFVGLLLKWSGFAPPMASPPIFETIAIIFSSTVVLALLFSKQILSIVHLLALVPVTFLFWSIAKPELLSIALPGLFFVTLGIPRLLRSLILVNLEPNGTVETLSLALRAASFWRRLEVFVIFLVLMPFGTFYGFNLLVKLPIAAPICAASLTLALVVVLGRILQVTQDRGEPQRPIGHWESVIGIVSLVSLIVLGIYPSPLYNYMNFLTSAP
jgi:hypothetical protein